MLTSKDLIVFEVTILCENPDNIPRTIKATLEDATTYVISISINNTKIGRQPSSAICLRIDFKPN